MRRENPFPRSTAAIVTALLAVVALAGCADQPPTWKLVWEDQFDGPAGAPPDPLYWDYDVGGGGWGNAQLEFDTARPDNVSLDGHGFLAITARKEAYQGRSYTSARLVTRGKFEQALGRWEARIRMPGGKGIWPAFWLLGASYPEVGWPACGEIDVVELRGQSPAVANGSLHATGYSGGDAITAQRVCEVAPTCAAPPCTPVCPFDADFHVYAVEIETGRIRFLVDGNVYQTVRSDRLPTGSAWPFAAPFFAILNVAVGGNYVGAPDDSTVFPQTMLVDYVRYYQLEP